MTINKDSPIRRFLLQKTRLFYVFRQKKYQERTARLALLYPASANWASSASFVTMLIRIKGIEGFAVRARGEDPDPSNIG
jgi:hypothetical protein